MKLKSYLRGLGLGMIVTTIILVIAFRARGREMTDSEIISRAQQLGMVETSLFDSSDREETSSSSQESQSESSGEGMTEPDSTSETETSSEDSSEAPSETTPAESESSTQEEATTEKETETATEDTTEETTKETTSVSSLVSVIFENITSADKASRILYDAGLIQNVEEFNKYLSDNGYARKIGEGTFEFRKGMSFEEIAKIITRQK